MQAERKNTGKTPWSYLDFEALRPLAEVTGDYCGMNWVALEETVQVMVFGATKYARDNWKKGMRTTMCADSLLRHQLQLTKGEGVDPETKLSHYAHILCNAMFISYYNINLPELDDRQNIINPEIVIEHKICTSERDALEMLYRCMAAYMAGQTTDYVDDLPMIGYVMHYACVGHAHQLLRKKNTDSPDFFICSSDEANL